MNTNVVVLSGRLTKDPELKTTRSGKPVTSFRLAVDKYHADGEDTADFFTIVAWSGLAENVCKYLRKGAKATVNGRLTTRDYTDRYGVDRAAVEVVANFIEFTDTGSRPTQETNTLHTTTQETFEPYTPDDADQLPF